MSKIPWTEKTWNPVVGCTKCSPGCLNCYAERMAFRLKCMSFGYDAVNRNNKGLQRYEKVIDLRTGKWNGKVFCDEKALEIPLHWKNPRRIFVCSMSDLFHESVPFEFIEKVVGMAQRCNWHTFQFLTKRPERAKQFYEWLNDKFEYTQMPNVFEMAQNIWLGVSISTPDELYKARTLSQIPAAVKFISFEPLLADMGIVNLNWIDQIIIGAESKGSHPGRHCELNWVRNLINQYKGAIFIKQLHINGQLIKYPKDKNKFPSWAQRWEFPKGGK